MSATREEQRFRQIYRRVHAGHPACIADEWAGTACARASGPVDRPVVWSRRNGPWRRVPLLWVGAAPGNAGGRGAGDLGAHATRIPFGGDIAGANLDALLGSIGISRNDTFITAALNQLPARGGGEPTSAELRAPVGDYPSSIHLLRDTIVASGASLIVALGNVALRAIAAAAQLTGDDVRFPTIARIGVNGFRRGGVAALETLHQPDDDFVRAWRTAWNDPLPHILWLTHPSGQNMSPFAREDTLFHQRMLDARDALRRAVRERLGWRPPRQRPQPPETGIYALPDWRERVGRRHAELNARWRERGV
ncbi:MAG: uracil-DNA glycosylase family protein [Longimicrobiales bacterium]